MKIKANPTQRLLAGLKLYAYQKRWIRDEARFKLAAKARQIGYTFAAALRVVLRRLEKPGLTVWISASDRQSREAMEHVKRFLRLARVIAEFAEIEFDPETKVQSATLPNGSRILALPANPDTVRGYAGDVVLDEFAYHRDAEAMWRAAFAIASRGYQLEVISTPNGARGRFYDLARAAGLVEPSPAQRAAGQWSEGVWSVHWCDIHQAVAEGCPLNIEELKAAAIDRDTWLQEEEVVFLADADHYFPPELIIGCESVDAWTDPPGGWVAHGPLYLGYDVGRKRDLSILWLWEKLGDVLWTRKVVVLERTPFHAQQEVLHAHLAGVLRGCIDATGLGAMLAEEAQRKFGAKAEPVDFTVLSKEKMVTGLKRLMEERLVRIPFSPAIRHAFGAIKRFIGPTGNARFDAERSEYGHADHFWGAALGAAAAAGPTISVELMSGGRLSAAAQAAGFGGHSGRGSLLNASRAY